MKNVYEGMFIFDSTRYAREPAVLSGQIDQLVRSAGGEMLASRLWEERRLAYPIKGQRKGTYWLTYFRLESGELSALNRQLQINDSILRHLFLKIDPRLVDALVTHAKEGGAHPASEPERTKARGGPRRDLEAEGGESDENEENDDTDDKEDDSDDS